MTLENIIWEAKQRPSTLAESRRPSTHVDDSGCTVIKGFVVPSRSSSFASVDSIALSTTSSREIPGTPLSPVEDAPPGYWLPSGSLFNAPELQCLKGESTRSLHRPTGSAGSIEFGRKPFRPTIGPRRSTWQQSSASHSHGEARMKARCKSNISLRVEVERSRALNPLPQTTPSMRRDSTEPTGIEEKGAHDCSKLVKSKKSESTSEAEADIDNAIASDSDSDDENGRPQYGLTICGIAAQRLRPTYATRRAISDQRVARQERARSPAVEQEEQAVSTVTFAVSYRNESAIDSDDEDDDPTTPCKADEHVTAALDLARLHRSRNSVTTTVETDEVTDTTKTSSSDAEPERPSTLRAKFLPTRLQDGSCETPTEIRSFAPQSPMVHKPLRPSRSQPPPVRGVLKNSCSQGHSVPIRDLQRLNVTSRRGSAPFIISPRKGSTVAVQNTDSTTAWDDMSRRDSASPNSTAQ